MKRSAFLYCLVALVLPALALAQGPSPEQRADTLRYLDSLRKPNGGYGADARPETPASVPATASAVRAIKYFGGKLKEPQATAAFLASCRDLERGTFSPIPGGKTDVRTTSVGLMALKELAAFSPQPAAPGKAFLGYLVPEAKTFEDIRIAAAAYEAWFPRADDTEHESLRKQWLAEVRKDQNADGTFGEAAGQARETGGAVVTMLRLGAKLDESTRKAVVKAILEGQRPDGGWGKADSKTSDLETTYRVMRCLHMLGVKPDVEACRAFVARCRTPDGSYGVEPGQPGGVSGTYFAGVVLHWLE